MTSHETRSKEILSFVFICKKATSSTVGSLILQRWKKSNFFSLDLLLIAWIFFFSLHFSLDLHERIEMKWISKPNRYTATCLCVNQFKIKFFRMPFTKPKKWNKKENKMLLRKWLRVVRITDEETKGNRTPKQTRKYGKNIPNIVPNTRSTEWKKNNKKIHKTNTKQQRQKTRKRCIQHEEDEEKKAHMWTKKKKSWFLLDNVRKLTVDCLRRIVLCSLFISFLFLFFSFQ